MPRAWRREGPERTPAVAPSEDPAEVAGRATSGRSAPPEWPSSQPTFRLLLSPPTNNKLGRVLSLPFFLAQITRAPSPFTLAMAYAFCTLLTSDSYLCGSLLAAVTPPPSPSHSLTIPSSPLLQPGQAWRPRARSRSQASSPEARTPDPLQARLPRHPGNARRPLARTRGRGLGLCRWRRAARVRRPGRRPRPAR